MQFDKYGTNSPGSYYQAVNHLLMFLNGEPEPEELDTTLRYTYQMRQSLFLAIIHQCTGGRAFMDDKEFNRNRIPNRLTQFEVLGSFLFPPTQ